MSLLRRLKRSGDKEAAKELAKQRNIIINETVRQVLQGCSMAERAGEKSNKSVTVKIVSSAWAGSFLKDDVDEKKKKYGQAAEKLMLAIAALPELTDYTRVNAELHKAGESERIQKDKTIN